MGMNPMQVAQNRTARLTAEAATPVYSTSTPAPKGREHLFMIEWESDYGRWWSGAITESKAKKEMAESKETPGYWVSDYDHAGLCWCGGREDVWN